MLSFSSLYNKFDYKVTKRFNRMTQNSVIMCNFVTFLN